MKMTHCRPEALICQESDIRCKSSEKFCIYGNNCVKESCQCHNCSDSTSFEYPTYVIKSAVSLSVSNAGYYRFQPNDLLVNKYDVIALQGSQDFVDQICKINNTESNQHVITFNNDYHYGVGDILSNQYADIRFCHVGIRSSVVSYIHPPMNIISPRFLQSGEYVFTAIVQNEISSYEYSFPITLQFSIRNFALISPKESVAGPSLVTTEHGISQEFICIITRGTDVTATWSEDDSVYVFVNRQCEELSDIISDCENGYQFIRMSAIFYQNDVLGNQLVHITAKNLLGERSLDINIQAQKRIHDVNVDGPNMVTWTQTTVQLTYTCTFSRGTHIIFNWQINNESIAYGNMSYITHDFISPGKYIISVMTENSINNETSTTHVGIYAIANAQIDTEYEEFVQIDRPMSMNLSLTLSPHCNIAVMIKYRDSDEWIIIEVGYYPEYIFSQNFTYIYDLSGLQNITILVVDLLMTNTTNCQNDVVSIGCVASVHDIEVLNPITDLEIITNTTVSLGVGEIIEFKVMGSFIETATTYSWSFGDGSEIINNQSVNYHYSTSGNFLITVTVANEISSNSTNISLIVDFSILDLNVNLDNTTLLGNTVNITALPSGGSNIYYKFIVNSTSEQIQSNGSNNVFSFQPMEALAYNITVIAYNGANELSLSSIIYVLNNESIYITDIAHSECFSTQQEAEIFVSVIALDIDSLDYQWKWDNTILFSNSSTLRYKFIYAGVYNLIFVANRSSSFTEIATVIKVQMPIVNCTVNTNSPIVFVPNQASTAIATIELGQGTVASAHWAHNGTITIQDVEDQFRLQIDSTGIYDLSVSIENCISSETVTFEIRSDELISGAAITHNGTLYNYISTNTQYTADITSQHGIIRNYGWNLPEELNFLPHGDNRISFNTYIPGPLWLNVSISNYVDSEYVTMQLIAQNSIKNVTITSSSDDAINENEEVHFIVSIEEGTSPEYKWSVCGQCEEDEQCELSPGSEQQTFIFTSGGVCQVTVVVMNEVSSISSSMNITVLQIISDPIIYVDESIVSNILLYNASALIKLGVREGYPVEYNWEIRYENNIIMNGNTTNIYFTPEYIGTYIIDVTASNTLNSVSTSKSMLSVEPIAGLFIETPSGTYGIPNEELVYQAVIELGSSVEFYWKVMDNQYMLHEYNNTDIITVQENSAGEYTVNVTAINPLGSLTAAELYSVQQTLEDIIILINGVDLHYFNSLEQFTLSISPHCSECDFNWSIMCPNSETILYRSSTLQSMCRTTGQATFTVEVNNHVSNVSATKSFIFEEEISGIVLKSEKSHSETGEAVLFRVDTETGTHLIYEWSIDGNHLLSQDNELRFTFEEDGSHIVTVKVSNNINEKVTSINFLVGNTIQDLTVDGPYVVATGSHINYVANVSSGNHIQFTWELLNGNRERIANSNGMQFAYEFLERGIFQLNLQAENDVSKQNISIEVEAIIPIKNVDVIGLRQAYVNQTVEYIVTVEKGSELIYQWGLNGEEDTTLYNIYEITYIDVKKPQRVSVMVYNRVSRVIYPTFTVIVNDEHHCEPPIVLCASQCKRTELKSHLISLSMNIDYQGCIAYMTSYKWTVYSGTCDESSHWQHVKLDKKTRADLPHLLLYPRTLDYGNYCLRFMITYEGRTLGNEVNAYDIEVIPSRLIAIVKGGTLITSSVAMPVKLDGSLSYDPDEPDKTRKLRYFWTCEREVSVSMHIYEQVKKCLEIGK